MKNHLLPALKLSLIALLFFGGIYTVAVWGIAQLAPGKGKGRMISQNGKQYYTDIGQQFTADKYFNSRPSAVGYNAAGSGASNMGPANPGYLRIVADRLDTFLVHNPGIDKAEVPVELITASGSGLDPDISVPAAMVQIKRIALVRNMDEPKLAQLVSQYTERPMAGLFGPAVINVLKINLALDKLK